MTRVPSLSRVHELSPHRDIHSLPQLFHNDLARNCPLLPVLLERATANAFPLNRIRR